MMQLHCVASQPIDSSTSTRLIDFRDNIKANGGEVEEEEDMNCQVPILAKNRLYSRRVINESNPKPEDRNIAVIRTIVRLIILLLLFSKSIINFRKRRRKYNSVRKYNNSPFNKTSRNENFTHPQLNFINFTNYFILVIAIISLSTSTKLVSGDQQSVGSPYQYIEDSYSPPSNAFYQSQKPQQLAYMSLLDSGSGSGPAAGNKNFPDLSSSSSSSSSSPVSPSLITAKCWNNYENDDECKHLNVITAPNSEKNQQHQTRPTDNNSNGHGNNNNDDDSIITPVVIFESSSTIEPQEASNTNYNDNTNFNSNQLPPSYLAPPYFSSTLKPDSGNVVLARHRNPPTANDVYAAPPAGATILPAPRPDLDNERANNELFPTIDNQRQDAARYRPNSGESGQSRFVTRPTTSVYVATPQPNLKAKVTTLGRTCRDENDEDCDEPTDSGNGDDDSKSDNNNNNSNNYDNGADNHYQSTVESRPKFKSPSSNKQYNSDSSTTSSDNFDSGSGDGPQTGDDNEDDDNDTSTDDDDGGAADNDNDQSIESSGVSDVPAGSINQGATESTRYVDISSYRPTGSNEIDSRLDSASTTSKPGAEIEVVVHPTLPPSFTLTTRSNFDIDSDDFRQTSSALTTSTTTTIMPDDTYKSKPIFPSTSPPSTDTSSDSDERTTTNSPDGGPQNELDNIDNSIVPATSTNSPTNDVDLGTFKPIPLPGSIGGFHEQPKYDSGATSNSGDNQDQENGNSKQQQVAERHKFDPNAIPMSPIKSFGGGNSWLHPVKPQNAYNPAESQWSLGGSSLQMNSSSQAQSQLLSGKTTSQSKLGGRLNGDSLPRTSSDGSTQRLPSEILSSMLLYSSIFILTTTAIICVVMSIAYWRRNKIRQQALLQKAGLLNGRQNQMVGSMSHGSHLMNHQQQMQQPSLLTTYSLAGQGAINMGKVMTSVVNKPPMHASEDCIVEEEESRVMNMADDQASSKDQMDGSLEGDNVSSNNGNGGNNMNSRQPVQTNSSWSTEDQTTSSGSQRTNDSRQRVHRPTSNGHQQQQYPNSMSDGRQNSSSISDSQGSPDGSIMQQPSNQQQMNMAPQMMNHPNQQNTISPIQGGLNYRPQQPMLYNNGPQPIDDLNYNMRHPPPMMQQPLMIHPSRSVEDIRHQPAMISNNGHVQLGPTPYIMGAGPQPINQLVPINNQLYKPPPMNGFGGQQPGPRVSFDGRQFNPPPIINGNSNGNGLPIRPPIDLQFNTPISPARVAMNPLATMDRRRYPPGMGLNRNIYSEDSSSFMTTSPSLARTSSSSSFAFNSAQTIRAKSPLVDMASGRMFNDFTPPNFNGNNNNAPRGPPIMGRKDRSEAWYV